MHLLLALVFTSARVYALTVEPATIEKILKEAPLEVTLSIEDFESTKDNRDHARFLSTARVEQVIQSRIQPFVRGDELVIEGSGGEIDGIGVSFSGFARPRRGQKYHAHLKPLQNGHYEIVGFEFGLTSLAPQTRTASRNRTDGSNGDGLGPYLYWDDSHLPIPYYFSAPTLRGLDTFAKSIDASFETWREVGDIKIELISMGCSTSVRNENDGINNIILLTNDWPFDPAAIAITRNFYVSGVGDRAGMILDSDILLNGVHHRFTTTNEIGKHDVQNIVTHEAGHFFGLGHEGSPADPDAVMYAVASPNELKKRVLGATDLVAIREAYRGNVRKLGHLSSPCQLGLPSSSCGAVHSSSSVPLGNFVLALFAPLFLVVRMLYRTLRRRTNEVLFVPWSFCNFGRWMWKK